MLRALSPDVPVTTNFMLTSHQNEQDYFRWAPAMDVISQDHYLDHRLPDPRAEQAFFADLTRGVAGGRPWMLMESATSAVNWQPVNVATRPGRAAAGLAAAGGARVGRRRVLPVAGVAGGRREVPLRAGAARRAGLGAVPGGGGARLGAGRARRGGRQPGAGRRRAALGLGFLVGLRPAVAPVRRAALPRRRPALAPRAHRARRDRGRGAPVDRPVRLPAGRGAHAVPLLGRGRLRAGRVRARRRARAGQLLLRDRRRRRPRAAGRLPGGVRASCSGCGSRSSRRCCPARR